jgi:hypothetical protein
MLMSMAEFGVGFDPTADPGGATDRQNYVAG